jgi:2-polyprenyl-3-methyl-5-hydroxy-6-metoxy-1,4-benzoquinol methylase
VSEYDSAYYETHCGPIPYRRDQLVWSELNAGIAAEIVRAVGPRTALDAGCGLGFLVEELRRRGVDARGVEISEFALSQIPDELRPYVRAGSVTEDLDGPFDIVTCVEVLEHVPEVDARTAVARLAAAAPRVLFSSTPDDFAEPTHVNVRPRGYWVGLFAEHGLEPGEELDATLVAPHAIYFRRPNLYDRAYYERYGEVQGPYAWGNPTWERFFGDVAQWIVDWLQPRTVLDVGCAVGLLVGKLRSLSVDATGLDVSDYALRQAPAHVSPYLALRSATEELPRDADLVVCLEVLEHLSPSDADAAVANIARHTDCVLFSSAPDPPADSTHANVRAMEEWAAAFGRHGLYRDVDVDPSWHVAPHAVVFRRKSDEQALRDYERLTWRLQGQLRGASLVSHVREIPGRLARRVRATLRKAR